MLNNKSIFSPSNSKVLTAFFIYFALSAGIAALILGCAALNSTKWVVTCFRVKDLILFSPLARATSQTELDIIKEDGDTFKKSYSLCFEAGIYHIGFAVPTINEYPLGSFGVSYLVVIFTTSLVFLLFAIISTLLCIFSFQPINLNCGSKSVRVFTSALENKTTYYLNVAEKLFKISVTIFVFGMVAYSAQQFTNYVMQSTSSGLLGDVSISRLDFFHRQQSNPNIRWNNESSSQPAVDMTPDILQGLKAILNQMDEDSKRLKYKKDLKNDYANLKLAIQPCFSRAYYWCCLTIFLIFTTLFSLSIAKSNVRTINSCYLQTLV